MSIRRSPRPAGNFYLLDKRISEDGRLSWAARGMLIYLLGKPDDWVVSIQELVNATAGAGTRRSGRDAVYAIIRELEAAGYIRRAQCRTDSGKFGQIEYIVCESWAEPRQEAPRSEDTDTAESHTDDPYAANPTLLSIEVVPSTEDYQVLKDGERARASKRKPTPTRFDADTGKIVGIPEAVMAKWAEAYPAVNVAVEIAKAEAWLLANPANRKSNLVRFLTNWLSRAQDRAPRAAMQRPYSQPNQSAFSVTGRQHDQPQRPFVEPI